MKRIDALFDIEREINGLSPGQRHAVRQERRAPLVTELERWMIETRDKLSRGHDLTKAFNYMLRRWSSFTRFLDDGRICLSNNAAERALRHRSRQKVLAVLRFRSRRTARCRSLQPDPQRQDERYRPAVLARRRPRPPAYPAHRIDDLLPWNWRSAKLRTQSAAA